MCRDLEGGPPEAGLLKLLAPAHDATLQDMENINFAYLLLFAASAGLIGFCHSRGHGLWSIFVTVFCVPSATLISIFVFTALFNTAFARGDEFLTLPDWLVWAFAFAVWAAGVGSLFFKKEDREQRA